MLLPTLSTEMRVHSTSPFDVREEDKEDDWTLKEQTACLQAIRTLLRRSFARVKGTCELIKKTSHTK
jgi:hypothetical protein